MGAVIGLAHDILSRHAVPAARVLGHSDVAPRRKQDPGELFDWAVLAEAGVGLWPDIGTLKFNECPPIIDFQRMLKRFGFDVAETGELDESTRLTLIAFQRHFRQTKFDGIADAETAARLEWLIDRLG